MDFSKKLNLLPQDYKDRYANRYILIGFGTIAVVFVLILSTMYVNLVVTKLGIKKLTEENIEYQSKQSTILNLEKEIDQNRAIVLEYERDNFPFYYFVQTVENQKPEGLTIISIDSSERLIEVKKAEVVSKDKVMKEEKSGTEQETEASKPDVPDLAYEKDLSGTKLVLRGYSVNPSDIAVFITSLSRLPYVADTELKAIEEHTINGTDTANIFEAILTLK